MLTQTLAQFVVQSAYENLPQEAIDLAKRSILDCIGCALAGVDEPVSTIMSQYARGIGGAEDAGIIGAGFKAPSEMAALANGASAHALDYDDYTLVSWIGHPSVAVLPAVLALAEKLHLSGKQVLTAYIVGLETGAKLGLICGRRQYELGWHNTATLGSLASAAAGANLLGLPVDRSRMALGIAASLAGGLRQNFGSMTKPLHAGNAARNGVVASLLAEKGMTASDNILETGFCKVLSGGAELAADADKIVRSLGSPFDIVSPGISLKPYPSCAYSHWAIDGALYLKKTHRIEAADVAQIELRCDPLVPMVCIHSRPKSGLEGKFSLQFCVAAALIDGKVSLGQFSDERTDDRLVQKLIASTSYAHPGGFEGKEWTGMIGITLKDGSTYSRKVTAAKGSPQNPLSWDELCDKYSDCASRALSRNGVERSLRLISDLESLPDVGELMNVLTFR